VRIDSVAVWLAAGSRDILMMWVVAVAVALGIGIALYDLTQRQHAILRNFPIIGHFRYWLEAVGPELRQYIVTATRSARSAAISADGSTRQRNGRTTTSASVPTTRWSCNRVI